MVDRLYENMLELFSKRQEQDSNSTLCNLKENIEKIVSEFREIVIVHYVI